MKKRRLFLCLAISLVIFVSLSFVSATLFAGGTGTSGDPYKILNWTHLNNTRLYLSASYMLMENLSSSSQGYAGIGDNWLPIGSSSAPFRGNFNGRKNIISNLIINRPSTNRVGFFSESAGNISNIGLVAVSINGSTWVGALVGVNMVLEGRIYNSYSIGNVSGLSNVGGLVGTNQGNIYNSYSEGRIFGVTGVGGLVGTALEDSGYIYNSYSTANIYCSSNNAGGLVGSLTLGRIIDSYSIGNVSGLSEAGGLVGYKVSGEIANSYSTGSVSGSRNIGGLIGLQTGSGVVSNSYWNTQTSGRLTSAGGIGKTTAQLKELSTFNSWSICSSLISLNNGYPYLAWQTNNNSYVWLIYSTAIASCIDSISPTVRFTAPTKLSGSFINLATDNFVVNVTANDTKLKELTLYLYNSGKAIINITTTVSNNILKTFIGLSDGLYFFNASACDYSNNCNSTELRNVTLAANVADNIQPTIQFVAPTPISGISINKSSGDLFIVNVSANDTNFNNLTLYLYDSQKKAINVSMSISTILMRNFAWLSDGLYFFNATACDTSNNCNSTELRNVTLFTNLRDTMLPSIRFTAPTFASESIINKSSGDLFIVNVSANDTNFNNLTLYLYNNRRITINATTTTSKNLLNTFTGLEDSVYFFNATACDTSNNCNSTELRNIFLFTDLPGAAIYEDNVVRLDFFGIWGFFLSLFIITAIYFLHFQTRKRI